MTDAAWVLKSIEPKSDQLNADDLIAGPIDVTITDVRRGSSEDQPVVVLIDGGRQPYKPCKTMRRLLVQLWGESPHRWVGQRLRLYCDPDVKFGGIKVGGIRISAMSGIDTRREVMLTKSRGQKAPHVVEPLEDASSAEKLVAAFSRFGVDQAAIEARLEHPLEEATDSEITELRNLWKAIQAGETTWEEEQATEQ